MLKSSRQSKVRVRAMGERRREKALESSLEQRIENRKLHPDGAFKNGSSRQLKIEKLNEASMKNMKKWTRKRPLVLS